MGTNTLHTAFTMEHTICHGGHFYSTNTLRELTAGLIHTFLCSKYITNTSHLLSQLLLHHIMYYFYQGLVQNIVPADCMLLIPDALLYFITNSLIAPEFEHLLQLSASIGEKALLCEVLNLLSLQPLSWIKSSKMPFASLHFGSQVGNCKKAVLSNRIM